MNLNPTDYIIMAYLKGAPMHVYKLSEVLKQDKIDSWAQYSVPHLYYSLRRLKENGLVSIEKKKEKSRPVQKIYSLTPEGQGLLESIQKDPELIEDDQFFAFDLLIGFAERLGLNNNKVKSMMEKKIDHLQKTLIKVQENFREKELHSDQVHIGERVAFKHRIRFLKGEIEFYKKSLKEFTSG
jgi:DNA-binding PadR family transcriptional regulator